MGDGCKLVLTVKLAAALERLWLRSAVCAVSGPAHPSLALKASCCQGSPLQQCSTRIVRHCSALYTKDLVRIRCLEGGDVYIKRLLNLSFPMA